SVLIRSEHLRGLASDSLHTEPGPPALIPPMGRSLKTIAETAVAEAEILAIRQALHITRGKRSEAARLLRIDAKTLYVKNKRYRILGLDFVAYSPLRSGARVRVSPPETGCARHASSRSPRTCALRA